MTAGWKQEVDDDLLTFVRHDNLPTIPPVATRGLCDYAGTFGAHPERCRSSWEDSFVVFGFIAQRDCSKNT